MIVMNPSSGVLLCVALTLLSLMIVGDVLLYLLVTQPMLSHLVEVEARLAEMEALDEDTPQ